MSLLLVVGIYFKPIITMKKYLIIISIVFLLFSIFATIKLTLYYYLISYLFTGILLFITFIELISNDDVDIYDIISNKQIEEISKGIAEEEKVFIQNNDTLDIDDDLWQQREMFWYIYIEDKLNDI
jgi:hypothetical protein